MTAFEFILGQEEALTEFHQAIRDRFQEGGSVTAFILAVVALLGFAILVYWLTKWQRRAALGKEIQSDPLRLYIGLLTRLKLTPHQIEFLKSAANHSRLEHPTVLLLSERVFDQLVGGTGSQNEAGSDSAMPAGETARPSGLWPPIDVGTLRRKLFPEKCASPVRPTL